MDYNEVTQTIADMGLTNDPAFQDLFIRIEPTPNLNGCPLGLYFPEAEVVHGEPYLPRTIVIPPDATKSTLKHELGHRYGHYYYNDLSERYAEKFRQAYDDRRALLYQGNHFERLPKFGALFEEGERGAVEIAMFSPLTPTELSDIRNQLNSYGESCRVFYGDGEVPFLRVEFTRGIDWLVVIGAVMAGTVVATVGALGYAVYKVSKELPWVVPLTLFGTGMFFLLRAMAREAKKYTPLRERA